MMDWRVLCLASCLVAALSLAVGCGGDNDDDDDDETDGGRDNSAGEPIEVCPDDRMDDAKTFLARGDGDAARAAFQNILSDYPECIDARFGVVLADQLRFMAIVDELVSLILDSLEEKGPIDVGAIVIDYCENLLEPIVSEMLDHLAYCREDESFRFELDRLPLELLGMEVLVYAGEYDSGDVLLQSAEFAMIAAGLDTILSLDVSFDFQIVIDHMEQWEGMSIIAIISDVVDMLIEITDDPDYPDFLRLRDDGYWRLPRAGIEMGQAYQYFHDAIENIRQEAQDEAHDVSGCGDRNRNGACDPDEFIHGVFYSLPSELHWLLQSVELSMRDSYWDGTELDTDPNNPNPFMLDELNPVLEYLGLPAILPGLPIDFGGFYANPDPNGVRDQFRTILLIIRTILDLMDEEERTDSLDSQSLDDANTLELKGHVPQGPPAVGIETVRDIAGLPYIRPTARTKQFSAHDPTGGNQDGFTPPNHLYVDEHGEFVLFDQFGPGCIYRMWITTTWSVISNVRIYVDDMEVPAIEGPLLALFFSAFEPFSEPLVEDFTSSSGGWVSYLPIPFEGRCKVTYNVPPEFFNVTYVSYDADTFVASYTGAEDYAPLRLQWLLRGQDPKPDAASHARSGTAEIDAGQEAEILDESGDGAVWRLFVDVDPFDQEAIEGLWIRAWWDGSSEPDIEAPLNDFFASHFIDDAPRGLLVGHDGERFYCFLPMPFWQSARMTIENRGGSPAAVSWEAIVAEEAYSEGAGYLKAVYNDEDPVPAGRDYSIGLREGAAGKFVGLAHTMRGPTSRWYLEGDERFYVDGSASPSLYGTGTEDYYNSGWYFIMGTYDQTLWGNPSHRDLGGQDATTAYRFHVGDAVSFLDAARLGIQHGGANEAVTAHYSSVAFFYELPGPMIELSDSLDVGDSADEAAHSYQAIDGRPSGDLTSYYEGEDDGVPVTDSGMIVRSESRFRLAIDPGNVGVVLRRRLDQRNAGQQARVLVDGVEVGTWYTPESSRYLRWAEDDFVLPASSTEGKQNVEVTVQVEGEVAWTEFMYWAYSIIP